MGSIPRGSGEWMYGVETLPIGRPYIIDSLPGGG